MFYDVTYKSPKGNIGTHYKVEASSVEEVSKISPIMLCYGTPFKPEEFTVLAVVPHQEVLKDTKLLKENKDEK